MLDQPPAAVCLVAPLHYEPNYAYPLLVWLHGSGSDEREVKRIMPLVSLRNYVAVGLRGPVARGGGFGWPQTAEAIATAGEHLAEAIARAQQKYHLHPQRVYVAGHGSSGTMALRLALDAPELVAGAISLGGPFPSGRAPLRRLAAVRQLRLLLMQGRDSGTYPLLRVCEELRLLHAAGISVTLRQYPCGDELTTQMLHDLDVWLMEQVTGVVREERPQMTPLSEHWN
jgi:phospholipase/carboxylesterase